MKNLLLIISLILTISCSVSKPHYLIVENCTPNKIECINEYGNSKTLINPDNLDIHSGDTLKPKFYSF